ncbi:MAG: peptidylprolyl isomerase [Salinibacter sp.]
MRVLLPDVRVRDLILLVGGLLVLFLGSGCQTEEPPSSYVARVGSHYLTEADLARRLDGMGPTPDSAAARQQIIDQWVTRMLLYREAKRRNLASVEAVQRRIEHQRRSILIASLKNRLYDETDLTPSPQSVRTYFERHKKQLQLREPYVRIRYLATTQRAGARTVRQALRTQSAETDSNWTRLVRTHAADTTQAYQLSRRLFPKGQVAAALPFLSETLAGLDEGETAPVVKHDGRYHVLRLDRRIPAGTTPKLEWVDTKIRRRLRIRARKQMYTHEVQRLRNKARADSALETP